MQNYQPTSREQVEQLLEDTKANKSKNGRVKKKWSVRRIIGSTISSMIVLMLVFTLASLVKTRLEGGYAQLFGYRIFQVETGSMIPTLPIGSFILTHVPENPATLPVGTVITYTHETAVITHRIVDVVFEKNENGQERLMYATKGDNPENSVDPWRVSPDSILGEMVWNVHIAF
ncbi:MAG: signal peptidase I [Clostridia bacterium]